METSLKVIFNKQTLPPNPGIEQATKVRGGEAAFTTCGYLSLIKVERVYPRKSKFRENRVLHFNTIRKIKEVRAKKKNMRIFSQIIAYFLFHLDILLHYNK